MNRKPIETAKGGSLRGHVEPYMVAWPPHLFTWYVPIDRLRYVVRNGGNLSAHLDCIY
jgi:hypothetical protein